MNIIPINNGAEPIQSAIGKSDRHKTITVKNNTVNLITEKENSENSYVFVFPCQSYFSRSSLENVVAG